MILLIFAEKNIQVAKIIVLEEDIAIQIQENVNAYLTILEMIAVLLRCE